MCIRDRLLDDLHGDAALAGSYIKIIERMYEGGSALFRDLHGVFTGFVINISIEDNFRSVGLGVVNLHQRCGGRHHDGCLYTVDLGGVSDTLRVVAGGSGYETLCSLFGGHGADLVVSAAHLVGAGVLHILGLQVDLVAGLLGEELTVYQLGLQSDLPYDFTCFFEFLQC